MNISNIGYTLSYGEPQPPFCDCEFPKCSFGAHQRGYIPDTVTCRCGEEKCLEWKFENINTDEDNMIIKGQDLTFHPTYSQGTAIVRGERSLNSGMVHFFEMRIVTQLLGTDVMIGIATDRFDINEFKHKFKSALGSNGDSWGFSYMGRSQHNGVKTLYGKKFSQGCIVGVYVDRIHGYLEFFINRISCGIAYRNIPVDPNIKLYPMIAVTPARTVMRLLNSISMPDSLQLRAFKALTRKPDDLQELREMPGMRILLRQFWFLAPPQSNTTNNNPNNLDIADEAVLPRSRLSRKHKFQDDEPDNINDLYSNAHKIVARLNEDNLSNSDEPHQDIWDFIWEFD